MGGCHGLPSAAGSGRATTFVAAGEALSVNLGSALCHLQCFAVCCRVCRSFEHWGPGVNAPPHRLVCIPPCSRVWVSLLTGHSRLGELKRGEADIVAVDRSVRKVL